MSKSLPTVCALLAIAMTAHAQQAILPARTYVNHTGTSSNTWRTTAFRFQAIYDASNFITNGVTGPITINRLRFPAAGGAINAGGATYGSVNVQLSSCPLDFAAASPTFANNRGLDNQLCFSGSVTTTATTGSRPNGFVVDIALSAPFLYDPTIGLDLVIEVDATAPTNAAGIPSMATSSGRPTELCRLVSEASTTAATGIPSAFTSECLIDFAGPGGYSAWGRATSFLNGRGCYGSARSFYELFLGPQFGGSPLGSNDLAGKTITATPNASGGYDVSTVNGAAVVPPPVTGLALGDDVVSAAQPLPFTFDYPGGSTTSVFVDSNGSVLLNGSAPSQIGGNASRLIGSTVHRLAISMQNLVPDGATNVDNVYFDTVSAPGTVLITWLNVPCFGSTIGRSTFQVALIDAGTADVVQFRYQTLANNSTSNLGFAITGFSTGGTSLDPGSVDLTAGTVTTSFPEFPPLTITSTVPFIGTTLTHTLSFIPANALLSARLLSFVEQLGPDLGPIGAPGCRSYLDFASATSVLVLGSPSATASVFIPNSTAFLQTRLIAQGASLVPGINALGVITSNESVLIFGNTN